MLFIDSDHNKYLCVVLLKGLDHLLLFLCNYVFITNSFLINHSDYSWDKPFP